MLGTDRVNGTTTTNRTSMSYLTTATVMLPPVIDFLGGRVLTVEQLGHLYTYTAEWPLFYRRDTFDSRDGKFHCILFDKGLEKYSVWAIADDLNSGPEYFINAASEAPEVIDALRVAVVDHLAAHPELGISISDFK